jgi:hypothetical protein
VGDRFVDRIDESRSAGVAPNRCHWLIEDVSEPETQPAVPERKTPIGSLMAEDTVARSTNRVERIDREPQAERGWSEEHSIMTGHVGRYRLVERFLRKKAAGRDVSEEDRKRSRRGGRAD